MEAGSSSEAAQSWHEAWRMAGGKSTGISGQEQDFTVLVADDSPVYRKLVGDALSSKQYAVLLAKSGREALDLFTEHHPEIVITDWMMPDLSGVELCQKIRSESQTSYTYLILLTSISEKDNVVAGLAAGADDYLTKPFHPEELLARVGVGRRIIHLQRQIEAKNRLLEELARTDALTGLPNRRSVEEWAARQLSGAARHGFSFWVVMLDVDRFKSVNDMYGHNGGDLVLQRLAQVLKANTRACDMCGRFGGEEFILAVTYTDEENIQVLVQRIRREFEAQKFDFGGRSLTVTASFGVAGFQGSQAPSFHDLVRQADAALYAAKRAGRNRIRLADATVR